MPVLSHLHRLFHTDACVAYIHMLRWQGRPPQNNCASQHWGSTWPARGAVLLFLILRRPCYSERLAPERAGSARVAPTHLGILAACHKCLGHRSPGDWYKNCSCMEA